MKKFVLKITLWLILYVVAYSVLARVFGTKPFWVNEVPKEEIVVKPNAVMYQLSDIDTILYTDKAILIHLK